MRVTIDIGAGFFGGAAFAGLGRALRGINAQLEATSRKSVDAAEKSERAFDTARRAAQASFNPFRGVSAIMGNLVGTATSLLSPFRALGGIFSSLIGTVGQLAQAIGGALLSALEAVAGAALRVGTVLGGALAAGMAVVAKTGLDFNLTVDQGTAAIAKMTRSLPIAKRFMGELEAEASISSLTFKEMIPTAQSLGAAYLAAFGPAGLGRVIPTMRAFQDTAGALGVDTMGLQNALLGFRQLLGRDFAQQEELNQIGENLPGLDVKGILRRAFGAADTESLKAANVTGKQVAMAIVAGMNQQFGGMQAEAAKSIPVLLSNFSDAFNRLAGKATLGLKGSLERGLGGALAIFDRFSKDPRIVQALAAPFNALGKALEGLVPHLARFGEWVAETLTAERVSGVLEGIGEALTTLGAGVEAFWTTNAETLGKLGPEWSSTWDGIKNFAVAAIKVVGGAISGLINVLVELMATQKNGQTGWQNLAESMRNWAVAGVRTMGIMIVKGLELAAAYFAVSAAVGLMTKNWALAAQGATLATAAVVAAGAVAGGVVGIVGTKPQRPAPGQPGPTKPGTGLLGMDFSNIGSALNGYAKQEGPLGAFARGYGAFGTNLDALLNGPKQPAAATPGPAGSAGPPGGWQPSPWSGGFPAAFPYGAGPGPNPGVDVPWFDPIGQWWGQAMAGMGGGVAAPGPAPTMTPQQQWQQYLNQPQFQAPRFPNYRQQPGGSGSVTVPVTVNAPGLTPQQAQQLGAALGPAIQATAEQVVDRMFGAVFPRGAVG